VSRFRSIAASLVALTALAAATPAWADVVGVPNVTGQPVERAVERLQRVGLEPVVVELADIEPGRVADQDPAPGTRVERGSPVELHVGVLVPIETRVPDVSGWPIDRAMQALQTVYAVRVEETRGGPDDEGLVLHTQPRAGQRLTFRGELTLFVGTSVTLVRVPRLEGRSLEDAQSVLIARGLRPLPVFVAARGVPAWVVLDQRPPAGSELEVGGEVEMSIALPTGRWTEVRMPSVFGLQEAAAVRILEAVGLRVDVTHAPADFPEGRVFQQSPDARTSVRPGSVARLVVAERPPRRWRPDGVRVPEVVGLDAAEAHLRLMAAGLAAMPRYREAPGAPIDVVLEQRPDAGTPVAAGSRVRIDLPVAVDVPDVTNRRLDEAQALLSAAGLRPAVSGPPGGVVGVQRPGPGERVARGSVVELTLGTNPGVRLGQVPDLTGRSLPEADALLSAAGFRMEVDGPPAPRPEATEITSQDPPPGTRARRGAPVRVRYRLVSRRDATVPDLVGRTVPEAQDLLSRAGLVGRFQGPDAGVGVQRIVAQVPVPETVVPAGSLVRARYEYGPVVVPGGPGEVAVPDVMGMTTREARRVLTSLGLRPRFEGPDFLPVEATRVRAQRPAPGTRLPAGAEVHLIYEAR
jgi:beta-lactam-binding protein with PASTA domain